MSNSAECLTLLAIGAAMLAFVLVRPSPPKPRDSEVDYWIACSSAYPTRRPTMRLRGLVVALIVTGLACLLVATLIAAWRAQ